MYLIARIHQSLVLEKYVNFKKKKILSCASAQKIFITLSNLTYLLSILFTWILFLFSYLFFYKHKVHCRLSMSTDLKTWTWIDTSGLEGIDFIPHGAQSSVRHVLQLFLSFLTLFCLLYSYRMFLLLSSFFFLLSSFFFLLSSFSGSSQKYI